MINKMKMKNTTVPVKF